MNDPPVSPPPSMNATLDDLRDRSLRGRHEIRVRHESGATGLQVVTALSDLADDLLLRIVQASTPARGWDGALVALGGYGRRELSPHSDIDLMFLFPPDRAKQTEGLASRLLCLMWDLGYVVGHSVRSVDDCIVAAQNDVVIATSLLEARFLTGNRPLFDLFQRQFFRRVAHGKAFLRALHKNRMETRPTWDTTPDLLSPNLKRSPGGLRDLHGVSWAARVRYGMGAFAHLREQGVLSMPAYLGLTFGRDFLWRIRNQIHFKVGQASDDLTVELQPDIAASFQFENVRELMRQYYLHTGSILEISQQFYRQVLPKSRWQIWRNTWRTRTVQAGFRIGPEEITVCEQTGDTGGLFLDDARVLRLFLLAKQYDVRIADSLLEAMRDGAHETQHLPPSPAAVALFKQLLSEPGRIAQTLRVMHRMHILWRLVPAFCRVQHLIQESRSHAYTVDEHAFRAVDEAERLLDGEEPLRDIYLGIRRKDLLHLALLLHDIGKGEGGDHSARGAEIAEEVALRLGYDAEDRGLLTFLVRRHLILSELAFYRDFSNEPVLFKFVREVAQPEILHHLLILTCADIRAVGPGVWTNWKSDLIMNLYREALAQLTLDVPQPSQTVEAVLTRLRAAIQGEYPTIWMEEVLPALIPRYLFVTPFERIVTDLKALFHLLIEPVQLAGCDLPATGLVEYTLYAYDSSAPGLFSKMTGVLAAWGFQIMQAHVTTHTNGMVVDRFQVLDPDGSGYRARIQPLLLDVQAVLAGRETVERLMLKRRRFVTTQPVENPSVRVALDNESSHQFTVMDVFAPDRRGLLYVIAQALFDLGLSVHAAKVTTHIGQIVDVFYVLDAQQRKISGSEEMQRIKASLTYRIEMALQQETEAIVP